VSTPPGTGPAAERLEMASRLDIAEHRLARCREVLRELRDDPRANVWRCIGRLEVILDMTGDENGA
jgi:hypothetical protein